MSIVFLFNNGNKQMLRLSLTIMLVCLLFQERYRAQDLIVKNDGSVVKAAKVEIGDENIKFKKYDNPGGPDYTLSKKSVISINYQDGRIETFNAKAQNPEATDEEQKQKLQTLVKELGDRVIKHCATEIVDNSTTEIYWDGIINDKSSNLVTVPIIIKWEEAHKIEDRWVKGKITLTNNESMNWTPIIASKPTLMNCAGTVK